MIDLIRDFSDYCSYKKLSVSSLNPKVKFNYQNI